MRGIIAVTAITLLWNAAAYAESAGRDPQSPKPFSQTATDFKLKAAQKAEEQRARDRTFDKRVGGATSSICVGCLTSHPLNWNLERAQRPTRPSAAYR